MRRREWAGLTKRQRDELKQRLRRAARAGEKVLMILDQYDIHTAKVVQRFVADTHGRLELVRLPSYCPNDNPQEKVWSSLQRAVRHNCSHYSLHEREMVTRRYLARLQQTGCPNLIHD